MQNNEIRRRLRVADIKHWELAQAVGIDAASLSRWLRVPLSGARLSRVVAALNELESKQNEN